MRWRFATGLVISLILLVLLFWKVPVHDVVEALRTANPWYLGATILLHLVVLTLKTVRWSVVLRAIPDALSASNRDPKSGDQTYARRWLVFDSLFLGYFGNYVLPAKLGEVGRSLLYSRGTQVPFPSVLATIVFERFLDALVLILAFYAVVFGVGLPDALPDWVDRSARLVGVLSVVGLVVLFAWARRQPASKAGAPAGTAETPRLPGDAGTLARKIQRVTGTFRQGLAVFRSPSIAASAFGWTFAIWIVEGGAVWLCLASFDAPIHWTAAVLQVVISSFAIAPPSAPGGLGIHQWVTIVVLAPFGVAPDAAAAASLVLTVAVIVWVVPLGLHGLWRQGTSTDELQDAYQALESSSEDD